MATLTHSTFDKLASAIKIILSAQVAGNPSIEIERVAMTLKSRTITVIYRCNGKRASTFISKAAFIGYQWNLKGNWAECFNLSNGNLYRVSNHGCNCPDYIYRRAAKNQRCKHQEMYSNQVKEQKAMQEAQESSQQALTQSESTAPTAFATVKPSEAPAGFRLIQDDNDWYNLAFSVEIRVIKRQNGVPMPSWVTIGKVIDDCLGTISANTAIGTTRSRQFKNANQALAYLLSVSDYRQDSIDEALKTDEDLARFV